MVLIVIMVMLRTIGGKNHDKQRMGMQVLLLTAIMPDIKDFRFLGLESCGILGVPWPA